MDVRLHIERLVLDGASIGHADRARLVSAVEAELGRLLATRGLPDAAAAGWATPAVDGGSIAPPANARTFGRDVARAVYRGLGGEPDER
jgi:hypothetical protein